ncbi:hypothetical protein E8E13_010139 [Curvularia kusanoi]|uniref:Uncharacterized protein n=1 Tax=Curvularia kusanoi TaxID=90978 RepID=A0A9P4WDS5_CURKU|nr:hypothetical protein E8E13_010139 [Curvularia kusanoi]
MCYLQETSYSCGHVQQTLLLACNFAKRLYRTDDARAPIFCLHGLQVVKSVTVEGQCATTNAAICDRLQNKSLKPLFRRQTVVQGEFADHAERIRSIGACLENGKRPIYNFQQIAKEGWDAREQQKRQDQLWSEILPASIQKTTNIFADACNEMTIAYTLTMNILLKRDFGISPSTSTLPALKTKLDSYFSAVDFLHEDYILVDTDAEVCEQVLHKTRDTVQQELLELEAHAVEACMDDVGWLLPKDDDAKDALSRMMRDRLVQPVEKSGMDIREAFICSEPFI